MAVPTRRAIRRTLLASAVALAALAAACTPPPPEVAPQPNRYDGHEWSQVADGAPWGARAGVEAAVLDGSMFLVGGRTPNPYVAFPDGPIPGDSTIWGDTWRSEDLGRTWTRVHTGEEPGTWPARSYHEVVVQGGRMVLLGGQNFLLDPNPACGTNPFCFPKFVSRSQFFNDVWASTDGANWTQLTADAPWAGRAGLSAAVLDGEIYVMGGSVNDDPGVVGGPPNRQLFNDVWKSADGVTWTQVTSAAPWAARAGASVVVRDGAIYLFGGEYAFTGSPPPYFNDVWRTTDGANWELVTPAAGWSPRPGHTCDVLDGSFVCFGGYGQSPNPLDVFGRKSPMDMWTSDDGATWTKMRQVPWNARTEAGIRYDYDTVVAPAGPGGQGDAIYTFGGDRETFNFFDPTQWLNVDDDVWRFALPAGT
jgi:hypothetical protein